MQGFDYPVLAVCGLHGPIGHGMGVVAGERFTPVAKVLRGREGPPLRLSALAYATAGTPLAQAHPLCLAALDAIWGGF
jgi:hypothetical protein